MRPSYDPASGDATDSPGRLPNGAFNAKFACHIPMTVANTGHTPENSSGVPIVFQFEQPRIITPPKRLPPVGLGRVGFINVSSRVRRDLAKSFHFDFPEDSRKIFFYCFIQIRP